MNMNPHDIGLWILVALVVIVEIRAHQRVLARKRRKI
jgi:hypothetical protein